MTTKPKKTKKTRDTASKVKAQYKGLEKMSYRDIKRQAISLGMPFPDATAATVHDLTSYTYHSTQKKNMDLVIEYDKWMDHQLELAGYAEDDPMRHYQLNLSYVGEDAMTNIPKMSKKPKTPREAKPPREKDTDGLWKGTKKSYTFELTKKGYDLGRITRRVVKKFPDANPSSIKQWHKKAIKTYGQIQG